MHSGHHDGHGARDRKARSAAATAAACEALGETTTATAVVAATATATATATAKRGWSCDSAFACARAFLAEFRAAATGLRVARTPATDAGFRAVAVLAGASSFGAAGAAFAARFTGEAIDAVAAATAAAGCDQQPVARFGAALAHVGRATPSTT